MIPDYIVTLVNVLTETAFAFLPAIICWSAYKVFGGTPVIGIVIGLMLVSPILPNAYSVADPNSGIEAVKAFGGIPIVGCQRSVLTTILTALIDASLEKKLRKVIDEECYARAELIVKQMKAGAGITEKLKATEPMEWIGLMNNVRSAAEEVVFGEAVYL